MALCAQSICACCRSRAALRAARPRCAAFDDPHVATQFCPLLNRGTNDTGLLLRLVRIALLARRAQRSAGTGTLTEGAIPRSILMHSAHPSGVVAPRASNKHGLPPDETVYGWSFGMSDASLSIAMIVFSS